MNEKIEKRRSKKKDAVYEWNKKLTMGMKWIDITSRRLLVLWGVDICRGIIMREKKNLRICVSFLAEVMGGLLLVIWGGGDCDWGE